jgi:NAD(P)-dependent dehydrogenase (short-subunit alcohol dehydrogenase family)
MKFQGKVAIVTGVSGDGQIGQAIAQAFAKEGARLAISARREEKLTARANEIRELGGEVLAIPGDLTDESAAEDLVRQVLDAYGKVDILVNLAGGLTRYKSATEHTLEDWTNELNNNLLTAFLCSRAVFEPMKAGGGGYIVNFARAGDPQAKMVAYNCAKAGVAALTRTLALEGRKSKSYAAQRRRPDALANARGNRRRGDVPGLRTSQRHHRTGIGSKRPHGLTLIDPSPPMYGGSG